MKIILTTQRRKYVSNAGVFLVTAALIVGMAGCVVNDNGYTPSQNLEIQNWYDLDAVRNNLNGNHILMNDLDSTTLGYEELSSPTANGGKGWQPIGTYDNPFTGTFDGQGYEIKDLFINRPSEVIVGLFSVVGEGVVIKNLGVVNVTVTGLGGAGGLVGWGYGTVSNSYSTGSVTGYGDLVGGLVGIFYGTVSNSHSTASITGNNYYVGGLGGVVYSVSNSYATGNVTGDTYVGGLVGDCGNVSNSYATGDVTGNRTVGGLVGLNEGTMSESYSTGSVTGDTYVGGLVGGNHETVSNSYSTGNVTGNSNVGGLVGNNGYHDTVSNSYSTGSVTGNSSVGGLVGLNFQGTVSNSYAVGSVIGNFNVGGLVGENTGNVSVSFWDTETSGQNISAGGTGKNTTEMQDISTFSGATWNITTVGGIGERNITYIWNIVNSFTYPFLSWQP